VTWLVTGGAGYIGSHVALAFRQVGLDVVVLDDLSSGHREFVPPDVPFVDGSVVDTELVRTVLAEHAVEGVVHLAGFKYAGVSVDRPLHTYEQNVTGTGHLLQAMAAGGVDRGAFFSSGRASVTVRTPSASPVLMCSVTLLSPVCSRSTNPRRPHRASARPDPGGADS